jgi:hypothetical protein
MAVVVAPLPTPPTVLRVMLLFRRGARAFKDDLDVTRVYEKESRPLAVPIPVVDGVLGGCGTRARGGIRIASRTPSRADILQLPRA